MMDEVWTRQWVEARAAAHALREQQRIEAALHGRPQPSLWSDIKALVRDLITPPAASQQPATPSACDSDCQSAA